MGWQDAPEVSGSWQAAPEVKPETDAEKYSPTKGMSMTEKLRAGIGQGLASVGRAIGTGYRSLGPEYQGSADLLGLPTSQDSADAKTTDAALLDTGAGKVGSVVGHIAGAAPAMLVPGANTAVGATAVGALAGAATTEGGAIDRLKGLAEGGVGGVVGKYLGDAVGAGAGKLLASRTAAADAAKTANAARDATLATSRDAGYVVPPSQVAGQGGAVNAIAEGVGGKIKTAQAASAKNQAVTNTLARQALLLPKDTPLTPDTFKAVREAASQAGYEPLRAVGQVASDGQLFQDLSAVAQQSRGASKSFPGIGAKQADQIEEVVKSLGQSHFDAGDAIDATKVLRESADAAFQSGDKGLARAYKGASDALEAQLERSLARAGQQQLLETFREARRTIAKSYTVEKAVNGTTGDVAGQKLAAQLAKGKPLEGDLKTAAQFAQAFPKSAQQGVAVPAYSPLDFLSGGASVATGTPWLAGAIAARPLARAAALSAPYQRALVTPSYGPGATARIADATLNTPIARALAQLTGMSGVPSLQR